MVPVTKNKRTGFWLPAIFFYKIYRKRSRIPGNNRKACALHLTVLFLLWSYTLTTKSPKKWNQSSILFCSFMLLFGLPPSFPIKTNVKVRESLVTIAHAHCVWKNLVVRMRGEWVRARLPYTNSIVFFCFLSTIRHSWLLYFVSRVYCNHSRY